MSGCQSASVLLLVQVPCTVLKSTESQKIAFISTNKSATHGTARNHGGLRRGEVNEAPLPWVALRPRRSIQ